MSLDISVVPVSSPRLGEIVETGSLIRAFERVRSNRGAPGIDGITTDDFAQNSESLLCRIRDDVLGYRYQPQPLRAVSIPKADGGVRVLGIPTVRDRILLEALSFSLSPVWEPSFSPSSFAYRAGRSALEAVLLAQVRLSEGRHWIVDLDIERFFDSVDHVRLMIRLGSRIEDASILDLIADFLHAGIKKDGFIFPTRVGIAQGSPLSPLLANIVLDELDQEYERRGWPFVRYADDCILFAKSEEGGLGMLRDSAAFLSNKLRLRINPLKSRVSKAPDSGFLGFTYRISAYGRVKRKVTRQAIQSFRSHIDNLLRNSRNLGLHERFREVASYVQGWSGYFGFAQDRSIATAKNYARKQLRATAWESWRTPEERCRQLIDRGVPVDEASNAAFALHFPDDVGDLAVLRHALPDESFEPFGLRMHDRVQQNTNGHTVRREQRGAPRLLWVIIGSRLRIRPSIGWDRGFPGFEEISPLIPNPIGSNEVADFPAEQMESACSQVVTGNELENGRESSSVGIP